MLDNWHRLERVIKWTGLSVNSFALNIGLKRSENLYQIKKGNNRISRDLVNLITAKYPTISKGWLLSGEGDMFIDNNQTAAKHGVPYYAIDIVAAVSNDTMTDQPLRYYINMQPLNDCDIAGVALGNAMSPDIPPGAIIMVKKWSVDSVIPGETYLVITPHFKGIRIIRFTENSSNFLLLPRNVKDYDPIVVDKSNIEKLYLVKGVIVSKNL